jgi:hypothetical protein
VVDFSACFLNSQETVLPIFSFEFDDTIIVCLKYGFGLRTVQSCTYRGISNIALFDCSAHSEKIYYVI